MAIKGIAEKVICAAYAEKPPVIDGLLDDPCWKQAEVQSDFIDPALGTVMPRRTSIRFCYDAANLYLGIECQWDDLAILKHGMAEIEKKRGRDTRGLLPFEKVSWNYGIELFLDPGASRANYYQIFFNVAGQVTGNYNAFWDVFNLKPFFRSVVGRKSWTAEFALPLKEVRNGRLKAGDEWGLNLVRNDETPYSIWKMVGLIFHEPKAFGTLVIGTYAEWWDAAWISGGKVRLAKIGKKLDWYAKTAPSVGPLYNLTVKLAKDLEKTAKAHPPDGRTNFEILYAKYGDLKRILNRLEALCGTVEAMGAVGPR